jgi:hypothetical protein
LTSSFGGDFGCGAGVGELLSDFGSLGGGAANEAIPIATSASAAKKCRHIIAAL